MIWLVLVPVGKEPKINLLLCKDRFTFFVKWLIEFKRLYLKLAKVPFLFLFCCCFSSSRSVDMIMIISPRMMASTEYKRKAVSRKPKFIIVICLETLQQKYFSATLMKLKYPFPFFAAIYVTHIFFDACVIDVPVPEQVLDIKETLGGEDQMQTERRQKFQWTVQRMRLSPQEKHLAASLICSHGQNMR